MVGERRDRDVDPDDHAHFAHREPVHGTLRALGAPATHGYYIFIIFSTLQLRPGLCSSPVWPRAGFAAVTAYTFVVHPEGPGHAGQGYPLQVYATFGILYLTCGAIAAWLSGQFRRHVVAALGEAAIRGQYERLVRRSPGASGPSRRCEPRSVATGS